MANTFATEIAPLYNSPVLALVAGAVHGAALRYYRASITLASQANADTITLTVLPAGHVFVRGWLTSSVSLGAATVAVGIAGTPGKYRAAATFTATDTPTPFALASAKADVAPLTIPETIILTIGAAALPASGSLVVDIEATGQ